MRREKTFKSDFGETIRAIFYAVLIALVIRTFIFEPFNIPSGSMVPTLLVGDYLLVAKYSYGYSQYSLPFSLPLFFGRILFHKPQQGDVVVFKVPTDNKTDYIKRVIGLPGDRIQVIQGILHINGIPVKRERVEDFIFDDNANSSYIYMQFLETLPNGSQHKIIEFLDNAVFDNTPEFVVPDRHLFMMGDNRDNSTDSRSNVGFVPFDNLVGRAEVVFFSVNNTSHLWKFWEWLTTIRFSRLLHGIS